jgi:hypothetical protein
MKFTINRAYRNNNNPLGVRSAEAPFEATYTLDMPSPVVGMAFSPDGYLLGGVTAGGEVYIWGIK